MILHKWLWQVPAAEQVLNSKYTIAKRTEVAFCWVMATGYCGIERWFNLVRQNPTCPKMNYFLQFNSLTRYGVRSCNYIIWIAELIQSCLHFCLGVWWPVRGFHTSPKCRQRLIFFQPLYRLFIINLSAVKLNTNRDIFLKWKTVKVVWFPRGHKKLVDLTKFDNT